MTDETARTLAHYIVGTILKQPGRVLSPDEPLITSGLIDSFSLVDLAMFVEDEFGVRLDDSELNASAFDSLAGLASLVTARQA